MSGTEHTARPRGPTGDLPRAPLRLTRGGHSASRAGPSYWLRGRASSPLAVQTKNLSGTVASLTQRVCA
jgi:hypothetical protein